MPRHSDCLCYVRELPPADSFSLRWGAHAPECPCYRVSRDPVDAELDREQRTYHLGNASTNTRAALATVAEMITAAQRSSAADLLDASAQHANAQDSKQFRARYCRLHQGAQQARNILAADKDCPSAAWRIAEALAVLNEALR